MAPVTPAMNGKSQVLPVHRIVSISSCDPLWLVHPREAGPLRGLHRTRDGLFLYIAVLHRRD